MLTSYMPSVAKQHGYLMQEWQFYPMMALYLKCPFLMQLSTTANDSGSFIQVMEQLTNLGPIMDMSVVDLDKQGQDLVRWEKNYSGPSLIRMV